MKLFLKTKDYSVTGEEFKLLHDPDSDMLITTPQPADLDKYYDHDYISHTDSRRNLFENIYYFIKKYNSGRKIALINNYSKGNRTLLDIGAGTGDFLRAARRAGWQVAGVEPNKMARGRASEKRVKLEKELEAFSNEKFQIITLWHVLEHLPDLQTQIEKIVSLLGKEGNLLVAVPNYKSFDAGYYQNFWAAYDAPRHLWHFSRTAIEKLFAKHGMEIVKIKPMFFDAFYVSLLSEKFKTGDSRFFKAFYIGLRSNIKAWKTGEYSSLLYILKGSKT